MTQATTAEQYDDRQIVRITPEIRQRVDAWRRKQPIPPSIAASVRYLLDRVLTAEGA